MYKLLFFVEDAYLPDKHLNFSSSDIFNLNFGQIKTTELIKLVGIWEKQVDFGIIGV